jgi:hypothetical protein
VCAGDIRRATDSVTAPEPFLLSCPTERSKQGSRCWNLETSAVQAGIAVLLTNFRICPELQKRFD